MKTIPVLAVSLSIVGATGCASVAPKELLAAHDAYDRAAQGPAATLDPTDLHAAKQSLDAAEQSFEARGDTQSTRDLGYVAERRATIAEARARAMQILAEKEQVVAQMHASTAAQAQASSAQLGRANQALAAQGAELQGEVQRRQAAEARAAQAVAALAKITALSVKQEPRGIVITLSGSVLFASAKAELLPSARAKLDEVADALTKQHPESKIVVEGHTDSQGSAASNQDLSERRAKAVRDYLVSRGIAADRVTSKGFGPTRSIADNSSTEGRANNRRVEIVVQPTP